MVPIQSTFIHGPNTFNRHAFMAPKQSTFIHGRNTIDIHSWPWYNRHSFMAPIQSTFIHGPNAIDIHSFSPIQSTFIHCPNTIDIHSCPQYNRHSFMACSHSCQQLPRFKQLHGCISFLCRCIKYATDVKENRRRQPARRMLFAKIITIWLCVKADESWGKGGGLSGRVC